MIVIQVLSVSIKQLLALALGLPLIAIVITYLQSWLQSRPAKPNTGHEPPMLPCWLPFLQHLPYFLWNPGALYNAGKKRFPDTPFTLVLAGTKFHVFNSPDTANQVFGRSRKFSFEPVMASMMENGVNLPLPDRPKFLSANSSPGQPKFVTENHNIWVQNLSGKRLDEIMTIYMKNFHEVLREHVDLDSNEWIRVNLHEFVRRLIFETSVLTFFGPRLRQIWPSMWEDWRTYDDATYIGVWTNLAYYLQPGAHGARERMFKAFEQWLEAAREEEWNDADRAWCESRGFKMNWERDKLARSNGFTFRGRACLQASFLFVIVTNAAPMASCFTWCAAGTAERLARYRLAANDARNSSVEGDEDVFPKADISVIKHDPYVHGLWLEALRLGTASAAARVVMDEDAEVEGYLVKRGSVLLMPVQLMHFDENVFPDPSKIQPERWMTTDQEQLKRMNSTMRPFGGGTSLCSGRYVAEHEIIGVVSTLLLMFDVKFEQGSAEWDFNPRSIGVMGPKRDPTVLLRRRPANSAE